MGYNPNHIPTKERTTSILIASFLFIYGTLGVIFDDLYLPGKRGPGMHFHGVPAWVMYAAFLFTAANFLSIIVDHYDKRDNEKNYKLFARVTQIIGLALFFVAIALDIFIFHQATR